MQPRKILIKFGTATITKDNALNYSWIAKKIEEIAELYKQGHKVAVVSSGAVAAGMELLNMKQRPKETSALQILSGVGQVKLMKTYKDGFLKQKLNVIQVLLTHHNFNSNVELQNLKKIIDSSMGQNIVPIINTNDVVTNEELMENSKTKFTDNDILAALVADHFAFDLLMILTDVDGLCDMNPRQDACAHLIEKVEKITPAIEKMATKEGTMMGTGGMSSKVLAAKMIYDKIPVIVGNGAYSIGDLLENKVKRTIFSRC